MAGAPINVFTLSFGMHPADYNYISPLKYFHHKRIILLFYGGTTLAFKSYLKFLLPEPASDRIRMLRWELSKLLNFSGKACLHNLNYLASKYRSRTPSDYNAFISHLDRTLHLPDLKRATFFGRGFGDASLNTYRYGILEGKEVFEKIYLTGSDSLIKIFWANHFLSTSLRSPFSTPRIIKVAQGASLTAVYFDFLPNVRSSTTPDLLPAAIRIMKNVDNMYWHGLAPEIRDFKRYGFYEQHRRKMIGLIHALGYSEFDFQQFERWLQIETMPHRFNHGDINFGNILACGTVLDLDECGYYPRGFDCGMVLGRFSPTYNITDTISIVVNEISPDCKKTQISVLFFMLVFCSMGVEDKLGRNEGRWFIKDLWHEITLRIRACH